jgi:hypothetical protein
VFDRATVRAVLDLFEVEGYDFYYNSPNNYGVITLKLFSGAGNPFDQYRGRATRGMFYDPKLGTGVERDTGRYMLNDAAVDKVMEMMEERRARNPG